MLASILALQLLLAQPAPSADPAPAQEDESPYEETPPEAPAPAPEGAPPAKAGREAGAEARAAGASRAPAQLSLLSAEPLGGASAALAWAGWSSVGVAYGQGLSARDDLGASLDFDWAKTELRLGAFFRRPLGMAGPFDMAGRLGLAWFSNFGATWIHDENHHDRGVELLPALVFSARGAGGIFSVAGELPLTVTVKHDAGLLFQPRVAASYEAPLYDELTVGVRTVLGVRAGAGDAPLGDGRGEFQFVVLAGYRAL